MKMQEQMNELTATLEHAGISFEQHMGSMVTFQIAGGECQVFPSQTYDGKLFVRYTGTARVDTADDALRLCGVIE